MPLAAYRNYSDPEQFEAAYKAAEVELTPLARGPFSTRVARLELDNLWTVKVEEASPRIKWATQSPSRTFVRFITKTSADFVINGSPLQCNEIIHLGQAHSYYEHTTGPINWAGMSLPAEAAREIGIAFNGHDAFARQDQWRIIPRAEDLERLRQFHTDAAAVTTASPNILRHREVVRSIEQSLIGALFSCLRDGRFQQMSRTHQSHKRIMRRLRDTLESNPDRALYVPEICAAIRVPERTLRACCQEQLGTSPKQYLRLRRLRLAHRALRSALGETTVTEVATRFGFWHFGRFAGNYRQIFGEAPSATLQKATSAARDDTAR